MKQIHDTYGDKVALVWKNEPLSFHPHAEPAAEVAMEALSEKGNKGFWDAHDKLFDSQPKLEDADLASVGQALGLDAKKLDDAMKNHKWKKMIDDDNSLSQSLQASGTPHFFINGRRLVGAQPFEKFKSIIDEEITKASALLAKGTPQKDLYDTLLKAASDGPAMEKKPMPSITGAPWKGAKNAKVTVVEFSDFQCPFCSRVEDSVNEVMKNYGDKIKFVWRNLPLPMHPDAPLAAEASMEVYKQKGSDGFWKMHDTLYSNQQTQDGLKRAALENYAQQMGLDMTKFKAALDSQSHKPEVDADGRRWGPTRVSRGPPRSSSTATSSTARSRTTTSRRRSTRRWRKRSKRNLTPPPPLPQPGEGRSRRPRGGRGPPLEAISPQLEAPAPDYRKTRACSGRARSPFT